MCGPSMAKGTRLQVRPEIVLPRRKAMKMQAKGDTKSELRAALGSCKSALVGIGAFSGLINLLMLTSSVFMLEVYDRVLPSRSVPTLVGLSILAAVLYDIPGASGDHAGTPAGAHRQPTRRPAEPPRVRCGGAHCGASREATVSSRSAISTRSARSSRARDPTRSSICPGFRYISPSASRSTP